MKINIPQEKNDAIGCQRKMMYAPNALGKFERFKYGSSAEEFATKIAVKEFEELQKESLLRIKNNISSPIEYFMYKNRMDLPTLSAAVGFFGFKVKRHLKYKNFQKLNDKILAKYADALNVSLKDLKEFSYE
ncbi:MAG: hypothetical protein ACI9TO_000440 [Rickettsiales bacterium]|jgi:hypothetical protein